MKACYPGTFDPITNGHLDIIERASKVFDSLDVLIMANPAKKCIFSEEERKELIEQSVAALPDVHNVRVHIGSGRIHGRGPYTVGILVHLRDT